MPDPFQKYFFFAAGGALTAAAREMAAFAQGKIPAGVKPVAYTKEIVSRADLLALQPSKAELAADQPLGAVKTVNRIGAGYMTVVATGGIRRNALGQFTKYQQASRRLNTEIAFQMQRDFIRNTTTRYARPGVATGRLAKMYQRLDFVKIDPKGYGFTVGSERFFEKADRKYWNITEYGSAKVPMKRSWIGPMRDKEGIPLYGYWSSSWAGYKDSGHPRMMGPFTRYGAGRGQNLSVGPKQWRESLRYGSDRVSKPRQLADGSWAKQRSVAGRKPKAPFRGKHVKGVNAFRNTWNQWQQGEEVLRQQQKLAVDYLLQQIRGGGL